jgi:hypothetical protein
MPQTQLPALAIIPVNQPFASASHDRHFIVVLLLEQLRPLAERKVVAVPLSHYARFFEGHFNDGQERHGMIAWLLAVLPATIACAALYFALMAVNPLLGFLWNIAILYLALGFRQFSLRGLHRVQAEWKLVCLALNLRRMASMEAA